jgi:hypothetical protein
MSRPAHDGTKIATEKFPAPSQEWDDCAHLTHAKGETQADSTWDRVVIPVRCLRCGEDRSTVALANTHYLRRFREPKQCRGAPRPSARACLEDCPANLDLPGLSPNLEKHRGTGRPPSSWRWCPLRHQGIAANGAGPFWLRQDRVAMTDAQQWLERRLNKLAFTTQRDRFRCPFKTCHPRYPVTNQISFPSLGPSRASWSHCSSCGRCL